MSDCVPYAIHVVTDVDFSIVLEKAKVMGWHPSIGMHSLAGWHLINELGFTVSPMMLTEKRITLSKFISGLPANKTYIISVKDHWLAVKNGVVFDKANTSPRTIVGHFFEITPQ